MSDIRIETPDGSYDNEDAYNRVIGYISNKTYFGGYGFYYSQNPDNSIIQQFKLSETYSNHKNSQKIWHFYITFSKRQSLTDLLKLADQIALIVARQYQIVYGLDTDEGRPHLHFGVNAFSYHPDIPVLTPESMQDYLTNLQKELQHWHSFKNITLQFQGKKG